MTSSGKSNVKILIGDAEVSLGAPVDLSIPLRFGGPQPNVYGVEPASFETCEYGDLVGDTRRGGSCNFERYTFIPHCSGTHTECVGHITDERIALRDCLRDVFIPALLVSIRPTRAADTKESLTPESRDGDLVVTRSALEAAVASQAAQNLTAESSAMIIRTLPNDSPKKARAYTVENSPYFSSDALEYIIAAGFAHLLVDLPSIDRLHDGGRLANHRIFWQMPPTGFNVAPAARIGSTITELIYVDEAASDGRYLLNLQTAPFATDAAPSRPIIFPFL